MHEPSVVDISQFVVNAEENALVDGPTAASGFSLEGEVAADDPGCLAKRVYDPATGNTRYWLKRATRGSESGMLFNPHSPSFDARNQQKVHNYLGRNQYEFRPATQAAFESFLRFLSTGNNRYLIQAERE
jgi:hypothetical protein